MSDNREPSQNGYMYTEAPREPRCTEAAGSRSWPPARGVFSFANYMAGWGAFFVNGMFGVLRRNVIMRQR